MVHIDHKNRIRQTTHILDSADRPLKLFQLTREIQGFFLGDLLKRAIGHFDLKLFQALDGLANGLPVGQHAAQPTVVNIGLTGALGLVFDDLRSRALGANKQHLVLALRHAAHNGNCLVQCRHCQFKVDDMNLVACTKNKGCHFGVPVPSLVTEVSACFQQIAHAD